MNGLLRKASTSIAKSHCTRASTQLHPNQRLGTDRFLSFPELSWFLSTQLSHNRPLFSTGATRGQRDKFIPAGVQVRYIRPQDQLQYLKENVFPHVRRQHLRGSSFGRSSRAGEDTGPEMLRTYFIRRVHYLGRRSNASGVQSYVTQ